MYFVFKAGVVMCEIMQIALLILGREIQTLESELVYVLLCYGDTSCFMNSGRFIRDSGWRIRLGGGQKCEPETQNTLSVLFGESFISNITKWKSACVFGLQMKLFVNGWRLVHGKGSANNVLFSPRNDEDGERWRAWVLRDEEPMCIEAYVYEEPLESMNIRGSSEKIKAILKYQPPPHGEMCFILLLHSDGCGTSYKYAPSVKWGIDHERLFKEDEDDSA